MPTEIATKPDVSNTTTEPEPIPVYDRLILWMFLAGLVMFALLLIGDLVSGFFQ